MVLLQNIFSLIKGTDPIRLGMLGAKTTAEEDEAEYNLDASPPPGAGAGSSVSNSTSVRTARMRVCRRC